MHGSTMHFPECREEALRNQSSARADPIPLRSGILRSRASAEPGGRVLLGSRGLIQVRELRFLLGVFGGRTRMNARQTLLLWSV